MDHWTCLFLGVVLQQPETSKSSSILLRGNCFAGIQKAVVDQMGSRPPNSDRDPLFGVSLALGSALGFVPGPATELVITDCRIKSISLTHHNSIEKWFVLVIQNKRR